MGGLSAVRAILGKLPKTFSLPIAIVQHRDKNSMDPLSIYLQSYSALKVNEVTDKDNIIPGEVYVAPANYHLLIEDGWFSLSVGVPVCYARPSIDVLFESAAFVYDKRVIGIILTGANQDGTVGLNMIKKYGGLTIAQDPRTAENRTMIDSAISSLAVDKVIPLASIGDFLIRICCQ